MGALGQVLFVGRLWLASWEQSWFRRSFSFRETRHVSEILGYSERGMINALCYEMRYSPDSLQMLQDVLKLCRFPFQQDAWNEIHQAKIKGAKVIIEQSFSDFGDADLLILFTDSTGENHAVFLEAKVKTAGRAYWNIQDEWQEFLQLLEMQQSGSNLFIQLYRKVRLVWKLSHPGEVLAQADVPGRWNLGANPVVLRACNELVGYCRSSWFVALVPDSPQNMDRFFHERLHPFTQAQFDQGADEPKDLNDLKFQEEAFNLPQWSVDRWGYLCWEELAKECAEHQSLWPNTLKNFEYNDGQIYYNAGRRVRESDKLTDRTMAYLLSTYRALPKPQEKQRCISLGQVTPAGYAIMSIHHLDLIRQAYFSISIPTK